MRVEIDLSDDDRERVTEYADAQGVKMARAYAELLEKGLDAVEVEA